MLEITSTRCGQFKHPEFRVRFDPNVALERDARNLIATLEAHVSSGQSIVSGQYLRFGWMGLHFRELAKDLLAVEEPDMVNFPVQFVDSVTTTLRHLRWQNDCAASVGLAERLSFPTMFQSAGICRRLAGSQGFFMERKPASDDDSGWLFECVDNLDQHHRSEEPIRVSLGEVVIRYHERVAVFLALPVGTKVLNSLEGLWISYAGQPLQILPGSFLDQLTNRDRTSRPATVLIDTSHNLLQLPAGTSMAACPIPVSQSLIVKWSEACKIPVLKEHQAIGIERPNTILVLTKNGQYRQEWTGAPLVQFDLNESNRLRSKNQQPFCAMREGDEIILIIGYVGPGPDPITKGGIAAMWSAQLKMAPAANTVKLNR